MRENPNEKVIMFDITDGIWGRKKPKIRTGISGVLLSC